MKKTEGLAACLEKGEAALTTAPHERRYLTGFASSAGYVLTTVEAAYFLTDFRYIEAARRAIPDMECLCGDRPAEVLKELLQRHGIGRLLVSAEHTSVKQLADWQRAMKGVCTVAADGRYDARMRLLRLVKTPDELEKIRQAQELTDAGYGHILSYIRPGRTERDIALELEFFIRRQGAEGVAFDFIVVSGPNSSLPHGVPGERAVEKGDFITMDFGAVVDGWHSDMTRTVAVGSVTDEQRRVYETVLRAQETALGTLRAGLSCRAGDAAARDVIREAGYGDCFGHSTGHGVGVEIHEEPRLSPAAPEGELLQPGSVVTVEPGIYLSGKFGVRIEDMAAITETGCENLTKSLKSLTIL